MLSTFRAVNSVPLLVPDTSKRTRIMSRRCTIRPRLAMKIQPSHQPIQTQEKELHKLKGISFGGAGIFFWWELGCVLWLLENVDVDSCPCFGASGGALAATFTACKIDPFKAFDVANRLSEENGVFERRLGVAGIWGDLIRQWLDELLPQNAAELCNDRVQLIVTTVPKLELKAIAEFETRHSLIEANLASCHIPFFLDGKPSTNFNGMECIDGSFYDFLTGENSDLLTCNRSHLNFDYYHDKRLNRKRLDFIALKTPSEIMKMIYLGYDYTEGLSKTQAFEDALLKKRQQQQQQQHQQLSPQPSTFNLLQNSSGVFNL